jgi:CheY-like chemotaxis protein
LGEAERAVSTSEPYPRQNPSIPDQLVHIPYYEGGTQAGANGTILLVEDSEETIITIADYLCFKEFRVVIARTGHQALQLVAVAAPDAILMDIQLPELDGLEAIRRMRAMPGLEQVPIVALTALAMAGDRERCLAAGANSYLSKPVSLRELHQVIDRHLHPAGL